MGSLQFWPRVSVTSGQGTMVLEEGPGSPHTPLLIFLSPTSAVTSPLAKEIVSFNKWIRKLRCNNTVSLSVNYKYFVLSGSLLCKIVMELLGVLFWIFYILKKKSELICMGILIHISLSFSHFLFVLMASYLELRQCDGGFFLVKCCVRGNWHRCRTERVNWAKSQYIFLKLCLTLIISRWFL